MYDNLAHLAALAHEQEIRRQAARPEALLSHELRRTRFTRRLLRTIP
jgi:hypothetical protein